MLVLWDADGNEVREELSEPEYSDLLQNPEDASFDVKIIIQKLQELSNSRVLALHLIFDSTRCVIDASLENGKHHIVKVLVDGAHDDMNMMRKLLMRECAVMRWISSTIDIPIPKILYFEESPLLSYIAMEKCAGSMLINVFGDLPFRDKVASLRSFARIAIALFHSSAPEGIGCIENASPDTGYARSSPSLVPAILSVHVQNPTEVFQSVDDYFSWLVSAKLRSPKIGSTDADRNEARITLKRLEERIAKNLAEFDSDLLRSTLSHEDLVAHNIFVNDAGTITGVIDWEFHMVKPAVLAANYPSWIAPIDRSDSEEVDSQFTSYALVNNFDAKRLHAAYDAVAEEMDKTYHRALKAGQFCRSAEFKLRENNTDIGCRRIKAWLDAL